MTATFWVSLLILFILIGIVLVIANRLTRRPNLRRKRDGYRFN